MPGGGCSKARRFKNGMVANGTLPTQKLFGNRFGIALELKTVQLRRIARGAENLGQGCLFILFVRPCQIELIALRATGAFSKEAIIDLTQTSNFIQCSNRRQNKI